MADIDFGEYATRPARTRKPTQKVAGGDLLFIAAASTSPRSTRPRKSLNQTYVEEDSDIDAEAEDDDEVPEPQERAASVDSVVESSAAVGGDEVATTNGEFVRTKRAYKKRPVVVNDMGSRKKRKSDDYNLKPVVAELQQSRETILALVQEILSTYDRQALVHTLATLALDHKDVMSSIFEANAARVRQLLILEAQAKAGGSVVSADHATMNGDHTNGVNGLEHDVGTASSIFSDTSNPFKEIDSLLPRDLTQEERVAAKNLKSNEWKKSKLAYMIPNGMIPPTAGPVAVGTVKGGDSIVTAGFDYRMRLHWRLTRKDRDGNSIEDHGNRKAAIKRTEVDLDEDLQDLTDEDFNNEILKRQWELERGIALAADIDMEE